MGSITVIFPEKKNMIQIDNSLLSSQRSAATSESCEPTRECDQNSLNSRGFNKSNSDLENIDQACNNFPNNYHDGFQPEEVQIYTDFFVEEYPNVRSIKINDQI